MGSSLEALKAEAAYFTAEDGMRTALIFFEMGDASGIPPAAEPFFMGLGAKHHVVARDERAGDAGRRGAGEGSDVGPHPPGGSGPVGPTGATRAEARESSSCLRPLNPAEQEDNVMSVLDDVELPSS